MGSLRSTVSEKKPYSVFISYRRNGGEHTAKIISDALTRKGYKVFFDVESLRSGDFNTKLYSVIEECKDFVLILSEGSLERCKNPSDWVRLEIECALKNGKNIIPIMLRNFAFPEELPESIDKIRYKNGIEANTEFFDAFIRKLTAFLTSKHKSVRPYLIALVAAVLVGLGVFGSVQYLRAAYPVTAAQKSTTDSLLTYLTNSISIYDSIIENAENVYDTAQVVLQTGDEPAYLKYTALFQNAADYLNEIKARDLQPGDLLQEKLDKSKFDVDSILMLPLQIQSDADEYLNSLFFLDSLLSDSSLLSNAQKLNCLSFLKKELTCNSAHIRYGINEMLLPVNAKYLQSFSSDISRNYLSMRFADYTWIYDAKELTDKEEANLNQQERSLSDLYSIVGESNYYMMVEKSKQAAAAAERSDVRGIIPQTDSDPIQSENDIGNGSQEHKPTYVPSSEMDTGTLWYYMSQNIKSGFYDQALACASLYGEKDEMNGEVLASVLEKYIAYIREGHEPYGVCVVGYNPNGEPHPFYKIGDIILSIDGNKVYGTDDLQSDNPDAIITVLRCNAKGLFMEIPVVKSGYANFSEPFLAASIVP